MAVAFQRECPRLMPVEDDGSPARSALSLWSGFRGAGHAVIAPVGATWRVIGEMRRRGRFRQSAIHHETCGATSCAIAPYALACSRPTPRQGSMIVAISGCSSLHASIRVPAGTRPAQRAAISVPVRAGAVIPVVNRRALRTCT